MRLSRRQFLQGAVAAATVPAAVDVAWSAPMRSPPAWPNVAPLRVRAGGLHIYQRELLVVETLLEACTLNASFLRQRVKLIATGDRAPGLETARLTLLVGLAPDMQLGECVELRAEWSSRAAPVLVASADMRVALRRPGEAWCSEGVEHFELRREYETFF